MGAFDLNRWTEALLACPSMQDGEIRRDIVQQLRKDIRDAVPDRAAAKAHVRNLVRTCRNYDGGLEELLAILGQYEGDSLPFRKVTALLEEAPAGKSAPVTSEITPAGSGQRVFISYRHVSPDEELAGYLNDLLSEKGYRVFIDRRLLVGDRWVEAIEREIRAAQFFLVLLSPQSVRSEMVRMEVKLAYELSRDPARNYTILPLRLGLEGELPYDLGSYLHGIQYASWLPGEPPKAVGHQLLQALAKRAPLPGREAKDEPSFSAGAVRGLRETIETEGAPLPQADPRLSLPLPLETGTMKADSPFYIEREVDTQLEQALYQEGTTFVVKGARQMGKSSALARLYARAKAQQLAAYYLDFQLIDSQQFQSLERLLKYLAGRFARGFKTARKPGECWDEDLGPIDNLGEFLEEAVLEEARRPLLLLFDEVDQVFGYPDYRDDFFAMVRGWHNRRATEPLWERLNLIISHSTEPALWIRNINQSPFNVGTRIRLAPFTPEQVEMLNARHRSPLKTAGETEHLMELLGGQPYLVRQALYCLARGEYTLQTLAQHAAEENGPFGDHLRQFLWKLQEQPQQRHALHQVLAKGTCEDESDFQKLRAAGLISGETRNAVKMSCRLYERYFRKHL